jgi:hypothetical protein
MRVKSENREKSLKNSGRIVLPRSWNLQKRFRRGRAACLAQSIPFIAQDPAPGNPSV